MSGTHLILGDDHAEGLNVEDDGVLANEYGRRGWRRNLRHDAHLLSAAPWETGNTRAGKMCLKGTHNHLHTLQSEAH